MIKTFIFDSNDFPSKCGNYCAEIEVDIEINAHNNQETDYKILAITNLENDTQLELSNFSKEEQLRIFDLCSDLADAWHQEAIDNWYNKDVDSYVNWCKENN